ncbi:oligopeptidase B [Bryocella elongata]|uniref:Oligopeptidase B n=1 Tax=Bryocella elongata TaxID=863522 RepID=A0A1H5WXV1_9BACT|nr:S9 family peptidase [Bryocella elongata]SEG04469.1 oligopeptidase B [Bryocella elongata]
MQPTMLERTVTAESLQPPVAEREPKAIPIHDTELHDDYAWLRDKGSPRVTAYLEAENAHTASVMAPTKPLQQRLYDEMLSHIKEDDVSYPYRDGAWEYITRTEKGKQYARFSRYPAGKPEEEAIILDVNQLAEGQPFMAIGGLAMSPDGKLLAYSTDNTGFRQYTLAIKNLETGATLADTAHRVGSIVWANDSKTLLYSTEDEQTKRQDRVFRHVVGSPQSDDAEIFHEEDERFNVGLGRTRDRKYLLLDASSHTTSEAWFLDAAQPEGFFTLFAERVDDEEYAVDHREGFFYIQTNRGADRFKLVRTPVNATSRDNWQEILPEQPDAPLEDFDLFAGFMVTTYRERGLPVLRVFDLDAAGLPIQPRDISFPDPAYEADGDVNRDFNTTVYRYAYQSPVRPGSIFEYNVATGESTLLKQQEVPGGFDASNYRAERLWFSAHDGTEVPVTLMYRISGEGLPAFERNGSRPLYVYGYGSYGYALPLGFSVARLSLLDRGLVVAYAHIRGGGELGDPWHDAGKMMVKRNTFTDFIETVEHLTSEGYGDPKRVAIEGGSAGGLLMGAVLNMKPEIFRVVLSHVPFVDVINTMLDASLPLTVAEYEEWGNPYEPEAFAYMRSYSPYDNLESLAGKPLPAILVKTSLNDSQVMYWEPAKYVAKLRTLKTDAAPLLLEINMDAGHGGASGRYDYLKEIAFDHAFLLTELRVAETISD